MHPPFASPKRVRMFAPLTYKEFHSMWFAKLHTYLGMTIHDVHVEYTLYRVQGEKDYFETLQNQRFARYNETVDV